MRKRSEVSNSLTYEQNYGGQAPQVTEPEVAPRDEFLDATAPSASGFDGIIDSMHVTDVKALYDRLTAALKLGEQARNDRGKLREALDEAEDNARLAHLLYCAAVLEFERWEIDHEPIHGDMWSQAREGLEQEQEAKSAKAKKTITNEDVKAKAASMFSDEWRRHRLGAKRMKLLVEHTKELADIWSQRSKSLNTMLGTAR